MNHFYPAFPETPKPAKSGMTRLEYYAAHALAGIVIANPGLSAQDAANKAVEFADALATALSKRVTPDKPPTAGAL